jgi:hypothetical protein
MKAIYPLTPKINNEMINRRKVSAIVTNARKKLEMAILERAGIEGLGIEGNFPDASIFRTVLIGTGLYKADPQTGWRFARPPELTDEGLRAVWDTFQKFFQEPSEPSGKRFSSLFEQLYSPPVGLRPGVLPVLLACAFRAFPAAISLRRNGEYVDDILPSIVEAVCRHPDEFSLEVLSPSPRQGALLDAVLSVFSDWDPNMTGQQDKIRGSFDSLRNWITSLPPIALHTDALSESAKAFRSSISTHKDPVQLLFRGLEGVFRNVATHRLIKELTSLREELESVVVSARALAGEAVRRTLDVGLGDKAASLSDACQRWTKCFSVSELQRTGGSQAVAFITRLEQHYDSEELLIDSLASQLIGSPTARWTDVSLLQFERALSEVVRAVESEAVRLATKGNVNDVTRTNLSRLVEARIRGLYDSLCLLKGNLQAQESISGLLDQSPKRTDRGNTSRSSR